MGSFKVIIVGGGLSGALLANGLRNNNVDFVVYERDTADSTREGYQIRLGDGAKAGFEACLTDAHIDAITQRLGQSSGSETTAPTLFTTQFKEIIDLTLLPTYSKSAGINRVVLRDVLLEPIKRNRHIKYGKTFDHYEIVHAEDGSEKVKVSFQDGSYDMCDVLVGADGANSRINKLLGLDNLFPIETHWLFVWKGYMPHERFLQLPAKLHKGPVGTTSNNVLFYGALYLPQNLKADSQTSATEVGYDEGAASFYWGVTIPVSRLDYKSPSDVDDPLQVVMDHTKHWAPEFRQMIELAKYDPSGVKPMVIKPNASTLPKSDWRKAAPKSGDKTRGHPRVWMMGDAIHAMQPQRGQGGNQSLHDCADILPQLLHLNSLAKSGPARPTLSEITEACAKYEQAMIPRAFEWVTKSGGTTIPNIDLDGWLGTVVRILAVAILPIVRFVYRALPKGDKQR